MPAQVTDSRVLLLGTYNSDGTVTGVTSGTSIPVPRPLDGILKFYMRGVGTIGGGTILIEEADWGPQEAPYSGTWSQLGSVSGTAITANAQQAVAISDSAYGHVRVRISSAITGGGSVLVTMRSRGAA